MRLSDIPDAMTMVRWLLMVPASFFFGWLAFAIVKILNLWTLPRFYEDAAVVGWMAEAMGSAALGAVSVYSASKIAPTNKFTASVVQAVVLTLTCGILIGVALMSRERGAALHGVIVVLGGLSRLTDIEIGFIVGVELVGN